MTYANKMSLFFIFFVFLFLQGILSSKKSADAPFLLFVAENGSDEVAELADTFLAEDGIGFAVELGGVARNHLLVPRMIRIFRDTRCLLTYRFPAFVLYSLGRCSGVLLVVSFPEFIHFLRAASEDTSIGVMPFFLSHHQTRMF